MQKRLPFFLTLLVLLLTLPLLAACSNVDLPEYNLTPMSAEESQGAATGIINPDSEVRGVWIASVYNIDYPSASGLSAEALQGELDAILETCVQNKLNTIFFQVRPSCDALYQSDLFPVSTVLSKDGTLPFDPLGYLVEAAHRRNIYVHAWVNPLRVTVSGTDIAALPEGSPAKANPHWTVPYADGKLYLNAGLPEVRQLVADGVREIVAKYDVDGVVFDDYFYPYPAYNEDGTLADFDDGETFALYGTDFNNVADWRRDNINKLVELCYDTVHATDPECVFGISPFGVWQNDNGTNGGSATRNLEAYHSLYCDALAWMEGGYVDYLSPQLYWAFQTETSPYDVILRWWNTAMDGAKTKSGTDIKLLVSHASYKYEDGTFTAGELMEQVGFSRSERTYRGSVFYGYDEIKRNIGGAADDLLAVYENEIIYTDIVSNGMGVTVNSPADGATMSSPTTYLIGQSDPYYPLTLNGGEQKIGRTKSGFFSLMVELQPGENVFTFLQNGVEYKHTLYYNATTGYTQSDNRTILDNITIANPNPAGNVITREGTLELSCVAPYGSVVTAQVNGRDYPLSAYDIPANTWSGGGYVGVSYRGTAELPQGAAGEVLDLGKVTFTATHSGQTVTVEGGNLRRMGEEARIAVTVLRDYTHLKFTETSSYYNDYTVQSAGMTDDIVSLANGFYKLKMGGYVAEEDVVEVTEEETLPILPSEFRSVRVTDKGDHTEIRVACENRPAYYGVVEDGRFVLTFYGINAETAPEAVIEANPLTDACEIVRLPDSNRVRYAFRLYDEENFYGFDLRYEEDCIVVTLRNPKVLNFDSPTPLAGVTIALDAGHGGWDGGAAGPMAGFTEKSVNLAITTEAAEMLRNLGAEVILTRPDDTTVALLDRVAALEQMEPDLAISVHQNSMDYTVDITGIRGTLPLYCMDSGRLLARCVGAEVAAALHRPDMGPTYQMLAMCRNPKFPATLIEVGFLTSVEEFEQMANGTGITQAAQGITNGVLEYFKEQERWGKPF